MADEDNSERKIGKKVSFRFATASCSGRFKEESENEDRIRVFEDLSLSHGGLPSDSLFICVDGHGGAAAANYVVKHIAYQVVRSRHYETDPIKCLKSAVKKLDSKFLKWAQSQSPRDDSGACVLLCLVRGNTFTFSWIGDCRAILHHPTREVIQLTDDHGPENPKERARLDAAKVPITKGRVFGILSPSRAFGDLKQKEMNSKGIVANCDHLVYHHDPDELVGESLLVMATDGVWCAMKNSRTINLVRGSMDDQAAFQKQKEAKTKEDFASRVLCKRGSMLGGDDTSAIIIFLENQKKKR